MIDFEFSFEDGDYILTHPYESISSASMFDINLSDSFSNVGSTPVSIPPGLVYVGDRQCIVIFERPPCYKTISYSNRRRDDQISAGGNIRTLTVPLPWQIYIGEFGPNGILNALHLYFGAGPVESVTFHEFTQGSAFEIRTEGLSQLFKCPLPNIYEENLVCLDKETYYPENSNLASKVNMMYASVWDTCFNADITYGCELQVNTWREWDFFPQSFLAGTTLDQMFNYWQTLTVPQIMGNINSVTNKKVFYPLNQTIRLSEAFIAPSTFRFFNTLQQII